MSKLIWILLFYLLIIITAGKTNLTITKTESGLETHVISHLKTNIGINYAPICKITDSKREKLFNDKIIWSKKKEIFKFNRNVHNLKYPVDNNNYAQRIHNKKKRDLPDWFAKLQEEERQKNAQLRQRQLDEEEKLRRRTLQEAKDRLARETTLLFVLLGILIIVGIVICIVCQRVTHKFERGNHEIQNFIIENNQLSERTRCINEVNGQIQISNADHYSTDDDDDENENDTLNHSRSYTNSALNSGFNVQTTHSNNIDSYDLPPTYEEAIANTVPRMLQLNKI